MLILAWIYRQPVEIIFKAGGIHNIGKIIEEKRWQSGVLIHSSFFACSKVVKDILAVGDGLINGEFHGIRPNPTVQDVNNCAAVLRKTKADFAIALGGGSVLDCAKAACGIALTDDRIEDYHTGGKTLDHDVLPLVAVPTTAGTGSEVTSVAVLTDPAKGIKAPLGHPKLYPAIALIDPELTYTVPPQVTASTGLDVLAHALEGFWSIHHQPICDALALRAAGLAFEYLERAYHRGADEAARAKMCEASVIAGLAFALPKTAAAHACSFPLTNIYNIPHGEACAFTLDLLCEINGEADGGRLHRFAKKLGFGDATAMGERIREMKKTMGMKVTLADAAIDIRDLDDLAKKCQHPNLLNNPVPMGSKEIKEMFLRLA